ncbi:kinase-like domain-containing protein [Xylaria sp. FL0043]|nr:kinase-like domain-containing protein [Xylaria sp. FL0043]
MSSVRDSFRQIDGNTWLVGESLLLSRKSAPDSERASWSDGNGGFFVLSSTSALPSETQPLSNTGDIQKVYDAGGVSAVWRVGEAFIKLKETISADATKEHTTLEYLRNRQPLSFRIPDVYYHTDLGNRYLIVLGRLAGRTLNDTWHEMGETARQECVCRIAKVCMELATWEGEVIGGIDGKQLTDQYLLKSDAELDFSPINLLKNCKAMGMDCSSLVFYHCDLGPGNILLDEADGSIGIIDWETAGYVPKEWIRTKFRCSGGLDLPERTGENVSCTDWRRRVSQELERLGFSDVVGNWLAWHYA